LGVKAAFGSLRRGNGHFGVGKEIRIMTTDEKRRITRRGFFEFGSGVTTTAGLLARTSSAQDLPRKTKADAGKTEEVSMIGKIAMEEHFALPDAADADYTRPPAPEFRNQMLDIGDLRLAEMDRGGVELCILSHAAPGPQGIPNTSEAIATSRRWNDYLAGQIAKHPKRLKGFAVLPMQDAQAAAQELTRCVKELGFCGALVNGFSQIGVPDSAVYYDLPQYRPFWATVQRLDVPFYLHPRGLLPSRLQIYEGHPWLAGSAWGWAVETSTHALRMIGSGLFDEYPNLKVILGHLGEGLPFNIWRADHRISKNGLKTKAKLSMSHYLRENFYFTTSGNFRTQTLVDVMSEVGVDRVLYSVDYPYEDMAEATQWFDNVPISEPDRVKIAHRNARQLFHL
jgi:2,3-dihydroxybenzoate decarboxylase